MSKFVGIKRIHRAVINIPQWRRSVDSQGATHLWGFLSAKRKGVNENEFVQFGEQDDRRFFDEFMRVRDTDRPYYDPVENDFRISDHYHSNAATSRKGTFAGTWKAAIYEINDGIAIWKFTPDYLNIISNKVLSKRGNTTKIPLYDVLAWLYHAAGFPDEITLKGLVAKFKTDFNLEEEEFNRIFTLESLDGVKDKDDNFFVDHKYIEEVFMQALEQKENFDLTETLAMVNVKIHQPLALNEILEILEKGKKQLVLQGPPGTGKTYVARQLAGKLLGAPDSVIQDAGQLSGFLHERQYSKLVHPVEAAVVETKDGVWDIVQFHPSYTYEDFVRGIVAKINITGVPVFAVENRIFGQLADLSTKTQKPIVLIVDEINRGDLSKVLGELVYALEYRNEAVRTPYVLNETAVISIGANFYLLATMNTADRSIALIDYAIRRRFAFVDLLPERGTLESYLTANPILADHSVKVLELYDSISKLFEGQDDYAIGHTYFMGKSIEEIANNTVFQVLPLLAEYQKEGILNEHSNISLTDWPGASALRTNHPQPFQLVKELKDWMLS